MLPFCLKGIFERIPQFLKSLKLDFFYESRNHYNLKYPYLSSITALLISMFNLCYLICINNKETLLNTNTLTQNTEGNCYFQVLCRFPFFFNTKRTRKLTFYFPQKQLFSPNSEKFLVKMNCAVQLWSKSDFNVIRPITKVAELIFSLH